MDEILVALNAALNTGENPIPWAKDAWVDVDVTKSYGVVTMESAPNALWADDEQIAVIYNVFVYLYSVGGRDESERDRVNNVLASLDVSYALPAREYVNDLNAIRYTWRVQVVR